MRQDQRAPFLAALHRAREAAYPAGAYVGQENSVRAGVIRAVGRRTRIGPGVSVLDLCCGVGGRRLISVKLGCHHLGLDYSSSSSGHSRPQCCMRPGSL
jgi:cyclopropane fatty-acyl-phospholipid synthase-like methyltransferase